MRVALMIEGQEGVTWQRVLFIELDRERDRRWLVQVVGNE